MKQGQVQVAMSSFSFKNLSVEAKPIGAESNGSARVEARVDWDNTGKGKGLENSYLLTVNEKTRAGGYDNLANKRDERSVGRAKASAYLFFCCFYNCCCCCIPGCGGIRTLCGKAFCCPYAVQCTITMQRDRWLGFMHTICFAVHLTFAILSFSLGAGKPMEVSIFRVKPAWNNTGRNGYDFVVEQELELRIDTVTGLFFALSALFHFVWVVPAWFLPRVWNWMIKLIDDCFCWWRFVEYSLSASLMLMSIGMITGLRDFNSMLGVFMLSFTTMMLGIITEMLSRPDGRDKWAGDPDPVPWEEFNTGAFAAKFRSYSWRMFPHFIGWFPYIAAWFIVLGNFFRQIDDLPDDLQDRIPWFVPWAIYGTAVVFTTFAFVQIYFQWAPPDRYWKTEVLYCILSLSAKLCKLIPASNATILILLTDNLYVLLADLGSLLLWNVILADSFDSAIALDSDAGGTNSTMPLAVAWHEAERMIRSVG